MKTAAATKRKLNDAMSDESEDETNVPKAIVLSDTPYWMANIYVSDVQCLYLVLAGQLWLSVSKGGTAGMCDMRGMLSFMILWLLSNRPMCGQELATEIGKRKGNRPNPGTIYPALKELSNQGLIKAHEKGRTVVYELTENGRVSLWKSMEYLERAFGDILHSTATIRQRR